MKHPLHEKVLMELARLGATRRELPNTDRQVRAFGVGPQREVPEALRALLQDFDWPPGSRYSTGYFEEDLEESAELWHVNFACHSYAWTSPDGLVLAVIADADEGDYLVAIDPADPAPGDPTVHVIDLFGETDFDCHPAGQLSRFLRSLVREEDEEAEFEFELERPDPGQEPPPEVLPEDVLAGLGGDEDFADLEDEDEED